jgi:hypothetical protein
MSQINLYLRFKKSILRYRWLCRALAFFSLYAVWVVGFRLLTLTFITYLTISPTAHFQDISDAYSSNEVSLMGLSSLLFVGLLYWANPLANASLSELISRDRIEKKFLPGFIRGALFAGGIVFFFLLIGIYRYLGYFIQFDEAPLELANVMLRMSALVGLVYCEGYVFNFKIFQLIKDRMPELSLAILTAFLYSAIKILQFDLGLMQLVTLFLMSISLFYRSNHFITDKNGQFARGAGFWAAILIIFQPVLSLPVFGNDFSGLLLIRYNSALFENHSATISGVSTGFAGLTQEHLTALARFLSGGAGGPLSSFAFQLVLILDISRKILIRKTKT